VLAGPVVSAQSIIVNPTKTDLWVNVRTNRDPSGSRTPVYAQGDHLEFYTRVNRDAYVYLFNLDPYGNVTLLASNGLQASGNFVKANTTRVFPKKGKKSSFSRAVPQGVNKVLALASVTPLNMEQIARFEAQQADTATVNAQGQAGFARALSIIVTPVKPEGWTTDTATYRVTAPKSSKGRR